MEKGIRIDQIPDLHEPILVAGFDGWGNALDISKATVTYLIQNLEARPFAEINPDPFYRYDENRPVVTIEGGTLKRIEPPGGTFYAASTGPGERDLVILRAGEPDLRWEHFCEEFFAVCAELGVTTLISLGSMYDNVLHSDKIVSGIAYGERLSSMLKERGVLPIDYRGPSAIHSTLQSEGQERGMECVSLWCHCPYYLQGATHFGLVAHLGALVSSLAGFKLDTRDAEESWRELSTQIQQLIDNNPEFQEMISKLRKAKIRGSWESMRSAKGDQKVIHLSDFLEPG